VSTIRIVEIHNAEPIIRFAASGPERYLTIRGRRLVRMWAGCDTCAISFTRMPSVGLGAFAVAERLRAGSGVDDRDLVETASRLLPTGRYHVTELDGHPVTTRPGDGTDYFNNESFGTFGPDAGSSDSAYWVARKVTLPPDAMIPTAGGLVTDEDAAFVPIARRDDWVGPRPAARKWFVHLILPLHPIDELDRARIDQYRSDIALGSRPVALAVSMLDIRAPQVVRNEDMYAEHWTLSSFVLDGHHKIQAAAEQGATVRLLVFATADDPFIGDRSYDAVDVALRILSGPRAIES
jgi:hypothetical protein